MKRMMLIGSMFVFFLITSLTASANDIGIARLSLIQGDVVVLTGDTGNEWVAASINLPHLPDDRVWVPQDGRTEIQFLGRTYLRADGNTEVTITRIGWDRDSHIIQTRATARTSVTRTQRIWRGTTRQSGMMRITLLSTLAM